PSPPPSLSPPPPPPSSTLFPYTTLFRSDVNPLLGPLQNNGGPTPTMALLPGSPALDAGNNTNAPAFDQRGTGFPRIVNGIIDIGDRKSTRLNPVTRSSRMPSSA